jgi:hypothetical protein
MTRFERAILSGNPNTIVPAALELPRPILLAHAVRVLLALRDAGDRRYDASAVRFAAVFTRRRSLSMAETLLLHAAVNGLGSEQPDASAETLEILLERHGETKAAGYVADWLGRRPDAV